MDFNALVLAEGLETPNSVMAYVQDKGSAAMQSYVARSQRHLSEHLAEARAWGRARVEAESEKETEWALVQRVAGGTCDCCEGGQCPWVDATSSFFQRNSATIDEGFLASCLAKIICQGPSKKCRVPLICGPTNTGKSTVLDPLDPLFGPSFVHHTPALDSPFPLANLALQRKRFLYWDEYQPIPYASLPEKGPTVPVVTFLKLLSGQHLEVRVSGCYHDGNADVRWKHGAALTAKADGLWTPSGCVRAEDVRHMKARVQQFEATEPLTEEQMSGEDISPCRVSFAKWLVRASAAFAGRVVPAAIAEQPSDDEEEVSLEGTTFL